LKLQVLTVKQEKLLIAGCGDIGIRLAATLPVAHYRCYGLRRRVEQLPAGIEPMPGDLRDSAVGAQIAAGDFAVVVASLTPDERSAEGYRRSYVDGAQALVAALQQAPQAPRLLLWVSSTSVYGQDGGEWIDETAVAAPTSPTARELLAAEAVIRAAPWPSVIVRFSGIYGPGRDFLLRQVRAGSAGPLAPQYTNRIHADDCAGVLAHLIERQRTGRELHDIYLASDDEPVLNTTVRQWLAEQMQVPSAPVQTGVAAAGKRCNNQRLHTSGFALSYPTYREGYTHILNTENAVQKG
jgi:nucleoside-diphosphate-sugar epimerase